MNTAAPGSPGSRSTGTSRIECTAVRLCPASGPAHHPEPGLPAASFELSLQLLPGARVRDLLDELPRWLGPGPYRISGRLPDPEAPLEAVLHHGDVICAGVNGAGESGAGESGAAVSGPDEATGEAANTGLQSGQDGPRTPGDPGTGLNLLVSAGPASGTLLRLHRGSASLGRAADLQIADPSLSRVHARIEVGQDAVFIHDAGSRNGVLVDGTQVSGARIDSLSRMQLAGTQLRLRAPGLSFGQWPEVGRLPARERPDTDASAKQSDSQLWLMALVSLGGSVAFALLMGQPAFLLLAVLSGLPFLLQAITARRRRGARSPGASPSASVWPSPGLGQLLISTPRPHDPTPNSDPSAPRVLLHLGCGIPEKAGRAPARPTPWHRRRRLGRGRSAAGTSGEGNDVKFRGGMSDRRRRRALLTSGVSSRSHPGSPGSTRSRVSSTVTVSHDLRRDLAVMAQDSDYLDLIAALLVQLSFWPACERPRVWLVDPEGQCPAVLRYLGFVTRVAEPPLLTSQQGIALGSTSPAPRAQTPAVADLVIYAPGGVRDPGEGKPEFTAREGLSPGAASLPLRQSPAAAARRSQHPAAGQGSHTTVSTIRQMTGLAAVGQKDPAAAEERFCVLELERSTARYRRAAAAKDTLSSLDLAEAVPRRRVLKTVTRAWGSPRRRRAGTRAVGEPAGPGQPFVPDLPDPAALDSFCRRAARSTEEAIAAEENAAAERATLPLADLVPSSPAQLLDAWHRHQPLGAFSTVLGVADGEPFSFDLRQLGPHFLVAGTTGAGKSELLQSLVLGLAMNIPPEALSLLLFDFKGGASFTPLAALPHVQANVTDLTGDQVQRVLSSIRAELTRRERLFQRVSVGSWDEYHRLADEQRPELLPRLCVVIDEFRMLLDAAPQILAELIRCAATGRSLGLHLILATQRPQGAVSSDIRANVSCTIALRLQSEYDSIDVMGTPEASRLPRSSPGTGLVCTPDAAPQRVRFASSHAMPSRAGRPVTIRQWQAGLGLPGPATPQERAGDDGNDPLAQMVNVAAEAAAGRSLPRPVVAPFPQRWVAATPDALALVDLPQLQQVRELRWHDGAVLAVAGDLQDVKGTLQCMLPALTARLTAASEDQAVTVLFLLTSSGSEADIRTLFSPCTTGRLQTASGIELGAAHLKAALQSEGTRPLIVVPDWPAWLNALRTSSLYALEAELVQALTAEIPPSSTPIGVDAYVPEGADPAGSGSASGGSPGFDAAYRPGSSTEFDAAPRPGSSTGLNAGSGPGGGTALRGGTVLGGNDAFLDSTVFTRATHRILTPSARPPEHQLQRRVRALSQGSTALFSASVLPRGWHEGLTPEVPME